MEAVTSYNWSESKGNNGEEEVVNLASNNPKKRAGRRKFQETRHPVYRGVRRRNSSWVCEVREPRKNSRIWLGTYPTLEMAARAHDVAAIALRGRSACLNFADSAWRLPVPASSDRDDIRKAAAEAAEAFRPQNLSDEGDDGAAVVDESQSQSQSQSPENAQFSTDDQDNNQNDMEINSNEQEEKSTFMMDHHADVDDEALFGMHGLLASMAEGLMLQPPPQYIYDDVDADADVSLWSF